MFDLDTMKLTSEPTPDGQATKLVLSVASHKANLEYYNLLTAKSLKQAKEYLEAQTKIMQAQNGID